MSVVEDVKQKTDIVEVIGQYTQLTKSGKTFRGLCPFHSEKHGSFFVYPDQQSWHCFGACGTGGDVFSFIMKKDGISFGEALRLLAEKSGVAIPQNAVAGKAREKHDRLYQANQAAVEYYHQLLLSSPEAQGVRDYLAQRGLNAQSVEDFKLGYSPNAWDSLQKHLLERGFAIEELIEAGLVIEGDNKMKHDRFRHRLMFPITDTRGRVIGFGGRALDDKAQPKYLNSPQTPLFDKSSNLYGLHMAKEAMRSTEQAVIVEGYMDVILPHQYGFKNVIASMGTAIGENHIAILKKLTKNLVLALDPDSAGEAATLRSVGLENSLGAEIRVAILPEGKDPDEIVMRSPDEWESLIAAAMPILDFTFEKATAGLDLKTAKGKSSAVETLMPLVGQIKDPVRQSFYLEKLGGLVGQSTKKLELLLTKGKTLGKNQRISNARSNLKPSFLTSIEEHLLALLITHPEFREKCSEVSQDCFEYSENREIFRVLQKTKGLENIQEQLDPTLWERYELLSKTEVFDTQLDFKLANTLLRLREEYLKRLKQKRADGPSEEDISINKQIHEIFIQREKLGLEQKRRQK